MSKRSYDFVKDAAKFFGITKCEPRKCRSKIERNIQDGAFGLTLGRSLSKHYRKQDDHFIRDAEMTLSQIMAFQTLEESHEHLDHTDEETEIPALNDIVYGKDSDDVVYGKDPDDVVCGKDSDEVVYGKDPDDVVYGNEPGDVVYGKDPDDVVYGKDPDDVVYSKDPGDVVYGKDPDDVVYGKDPDDVVYGKDPDDVVYGKDPDDVYGKDPDDVVYGKDPGDVVYGKDPDDVVYGKDPDDVVYGKDPDNVFYCKDPDNVVHRKIPDDVVYGKEALKHYNFFREMEMKVKKSKLQAELKEELKEYDLKIAAIDELVLLAKDYYVNPKSTNANKWEEFKKRLKRSSSRQSRQIGYTGIRRKLSTVSEYRPFFTYFIIMAQLILFAVVCYLSGFTYSGVEPKLLFEHDVQTFMGMETVHKWVPPNIWIGPSDRHWIGVGAVFAPCMRIDYGVQLKLARMNYSTDTTLGCCEVAKREVAGTNTQSECEQLTEGVGNWRNGVTCTNRPLTVYRVRHNMKPCCVGVEGHCRLMSYKHCAFLDGTFYWPAAEHCSQVNCLDNVCKPGGLAASPNQPWQPDSPSQLWRLPLSLLFHHGIIDLIMVTVAEWFLFTQIEHTAGWLRMLIIYLLSGMSSLMTSVIFSPYQSHVGAVGAISGMIGVILVELLQFWDVVHQPVREVLKLFCAVCILLFCGTLPYVDIFSTIVGMIVGILSGILVLPYVTFGKWDLRVRVSLILVSLSQLLVICYMLFHVFVSVQSVDRCEICKLMNCVPYTEKMCDTSLWNQV